MFPHKLNETTKTNRTTKKSHLSNFDVNKLQTNSKALTFWFSKTKRRGSKHIGYKAQHNNTHLLKKKFSNKPFYFKSLNQSEHPNASKNLSFTFFFFWINALVTHITEVTQPKVSQFTNPYNFLLIISWI